LSAAAAVLSIRVRIDTETVTSELAHRAAGDVPITVSISISDGASGRPEITIAARPTVAVIGGAGQEKEPGAADGQGPREGSRRKSNSSKQMIHGKKGSLSGAIRERRKSDCEGTN
jgi:hypothetical protein